MAVRDRSPFDAQTPCSFADLTLTAHRVNDAPTTAGRLAAEPGYGLPAFGSGCLIAPHGGFGLAREGARDSRPGTRLERAPFPGLSLEGARRESATVA